MYDMITLKSAHLDMGFLLKRTRMLCVFLSWMDTQHMHSAVFYLIYEKVKQVYFFLLEEGITSCLALLRGSAGVGSTVKIQELLEMSLGLCVHAFADHKGMNKGLLFILCIQTEKYYDILVR